METSKIYCGDSVEIMKDFPDKCIDLVVTSPPYDNLRDYKGYSFQFEPVAYELWRIIKDGGVVVWVVGDSVINGSESLTSFKQALYFKEIGFNIHDTMIYYKNCMAYPDQTRYYNVFEYMFIVSKGKPKTFNPIRDWINSTVGHNVTGNSRQVDGTFKAKTGHRLGNRIKDFSNRINIWKYNVGWGHSCVLGELDYVKEHPAVFPYDLAMDHIISWSNPDDLVLDPMCGSGTTLKAAKNLNRDYIGIDISKEYCEIAERRVRENILENKLKKDNHGQHQHTIQDFM